MLIQEPESSYSSYYTFHHEELPDFSQVYHFTTRHNLVYTVYFSISEYDQWLTNYPYLLQNGYAFGFTPLFVPADCKKQPDKSIFITLSKIIEAFIALNGNDCVLLYHCDHADNRQAYRNKLFDSWYTASSHAEQIVKHDLEIIWANNKELKNYYLGYLTPKSNPNLSVLRAEFEELSFRLFKGK
jgi:hypothetical protein